MTATTIRVQMAQRKDTAAGWTAANPILLLGEIGYETDTKKFKIGDGSTNWNSLAYLPIPDGSGNLTITGNLEIGSTGSLTFEGSTADGFETTLAVTDPTADRTITLPDVTGTVVTTGDTGSVTSAMITDGTIVNADISSSAEIAVSKLANGTVNQVLVTDGTDVSWSDNLTLAGDLTVNGTTTTINTQDLLVEDKNIIIGNVVTPTDVTADGGGITLKGSTDKTINWVDSTDAWTSSERFDIPSGTAAAPSLIFNGDVDSGLYSPGADQVAISTSGTGRLFVDSSGNVGINAGSPTAKLTVYDGDVHITGPNDGTAKTLQFRWLETVIPAADSTIGGIEFYSADSSNPGVSSALYGYGSTVNQGSLVFFTGIGGSASEKARIDGSGRLLIGTSIAYFAAASAITAPLFQVHGTNANLSQVLIGSWASGNNVGGSITLARSESGTVGNFGSALSSTDDVLGNVRFNGSDGTKFVEGANISAVVDGVWGTDDAPTKLKFSTTADGSATPTERMRIDSAGTTTLTSAATTAPFIAKISTSEKARIDGSGRLLIGTSTSYDSTSYLQVAGSTNSYASQTFIAGNSSNLVAGNGVAYLIFRDKLNSGQGAWIGAIADGTWSSGDYPTRLAFATTAVGANSPTERMRVNSYGRLSTFSDDGIAFIHTSSKAAGTSDRLFDGRHSSTGVNGGTKSVEIFTNGNIQNTNNSYGAISDIKLKENIVDANSQWDDLKALQVRNYNFKEGQTHTQIGLIAQEVELVSPGLVSESPDRDEDGNDLGTVTKSVNYSVLYMKAVKALQEAMERIETLEAKVAALEAS